MESHQPTILKARSTSFLSYEVEQLNVEQFWSDIWGNKYNFNHKAEWLKPLETCDFPM